ncbi:hypothetical protein [Flavihumibacter sp. UBA7668]|uniref:hypothetical protein n=1 Tax=Flavihumibacter sp. UBA7668 TaxID=1946542 RepID=UPI0025C31D5B|nr:hypothetical protein [Flavihumibacter sp. UBA7668]
MLLRLFISFLLLVSLALQSFQVPMMYVNYYANKQDFLANCENKSRPELACEGKCILMKKIKAAEQKEKEQEKKESKSNGSADIISSRSFFTNHIQEPLPSASISYPSELIQPVTDQSYPPFHPPC